MKNIKTEQFLWEPMWKDRGAKVMSQDECLAIDRLKKMIKAPFDAIKTVLNIHGDKVLRIERKYGVQDTIDLCDYFLFGPIVLESRRIYCKQTYGSGEIVKNKKVINCAVIMMDEEELAIKIAETIFAKEAAREAEERAQILGKLWRR